MRIIYYICLFLLLGLLACFSYTNILKKENKYLKTENNSLKIELKRRQEVQKNAEKRKESAKKLELKDKEIFDWQYDISNTAVVRELRKQCKSCSVTAN